MRIDKLTVRNFKKYAEHTITLHQQFTLLVGDNGSGKTSILDALAVSLAVWLVKVPDLSLNNSRRNIMASEIRLEPLSAGDRVQFIEHRPVRVEATGTIDGKDLIWTRQIKEGGSRTTNGEAKDALDIIHGVYTQVRNGEQVICPVLAYYGAGRAWLASNQRIPPESSHSGAARRWGAFYDCFNERIRFDALRTWFHRETTAAGNRGGRMRPGFEVVRRAVLACVPEADGIWFDSDHSQIVLSIAGDPQPFDNLSAGQRMMLALVADIAIKAVTQNAFLLPADELGSDDVPIPRLLRESPGVVLIDELDVHLHPKWQRRVANDLKATFPAIQFICTSHSPQVIGELPREQIRILDDDQVTLPSVGRGADSNWILDHVMNGAVSENTDARKLRMQVEDALSEGNLGLAQTKLNTWRDLLDGDTGELVRLESELDTLRSLASCDETEEE